MLIFFFQRNFLYQLCVVLGMGLMHNKKNIKRFKASEMKFLSFPKTTKKTAIQSMLGKKGPSLGDWGGGKGS